MTVILAELKMAAPQASSNLCTRSIFNV